MNSTGITASVPYTRENEVAFVDSLIDILFSHSVLYNSSGQLPFFAFNLHFI